jgi:hypothetical protein
MFLSPIRLVEPESKDPATPANARGGTNEAFFAKGRRAGCA